MKTKITDKAEFEALSEELKKHYKEENGVWLLQAEDLAELRTLLATEREARKQLETELTEIRNAVKKAEEDKLEAERKAADEAARKSGDVAALEKSWQERVEQTKRENADEVKRLTKIIENLTVEAEAVKLAADISTSPTLMLPIIKARLRPEINGDTALVRVLDAEGKPSASSIADLRAELVANKEFAAIIKASSASGSGANGGHSGGGAAKKISEMTEAERTTYYKQVGAEAYRTQAKAEGLPTY